MQHVDDTSDLLTEEFWQEAVEERLSAPVSPPRSAGRIARFFDSLAASMALQRSKPWTSCRPQPVLYPADILAQNHPYLYLRVMCG
jgi:hypothetical protein